MTKIHVQVWQIRNFAGEDEIPPGWEPFQVDRGLIHKTFTPNGTIVRSDPDVIWCKKSVWVEGEQSEIL